jgi:eukaryotic-like serine/threonine-protein kinase
MFVQRNRKATPADVDLRGQFAGEYKMLRRIGAGGFGAVYEAEHPILRRKAAVKVLHLSRTVDESAVRRFISEAQTATQIRHRHIVDIFSFGTLPSGQQFYVMDLLDGVALDRYLAEQHALPPEVAIPLLRPIAEALDALHARGIVHRDVKPPNIFLAWEPSGEVVPKLLDFGLVKLLSDTGAHTASGVPMGTPYYMSPEQCRGEKIDARADVYSFGIICHELMSGSPPFAGDTPAAVLVAHLVQAPPPLSGLDPKLPAALDAPILRMLAKSPADRYESVGAACADLERVAQEAGVGIPPGFLHLPRPEPAKEARDSWFTAATGGQSGARPTNLGAKSRRSVWLVGAALGAIGIGVGVLAFRPEPQPEPALAPAATGSPSAAAALPPPTNAPSVLPVASAVTRVALTLRGAPPTASVMLGDEELGKATEPIWLPFGKEPLALRVVAPGYEPKALSVVPTTSTELDVTLNRAGRAPAKRKSTPGDLENPF